jgi:hypothetical protein
MTVILGGVAGGLAAYFGKKATNVQVDIRGAYPVEYIDQCIERLPLAFRF